MVLYFYSLLSRVNDAQTRYSSGTFEASKEIASGDEFGDAVERLCEKNNVDKEKTVVTAFNRL